MASIARENKKMNGLHQIIDNFVINNDQEAGFTMEK